MRCTGSGLSLAVAHLRVVEQDDAIQGTTIALATGCCRGTAASAGWHAGAAAAWHSAATCRCDDGSERGDLLVQHCMRECRQLHTQPQLACCGQLLTAYAGQLLCDGG